MTFGERLTRLRKEKGYSTRNELAVFLGIPSTTLRNYETDVREPGHSFLVKISEFFNVSVDYLLGLTEDRERTSPCSLKASEMEHIKKYRSLDLQGQETVNIILDREFARIKDLKEKDSRIAELESALHQTPAALRIYTYMHKIAAAGTGFYFDDIPTETIEAPYRENADFIIGVSGDSMEPTFSDGDLVYVEKRQIVEIGDIGIFIVNKECFIKEVGEEGLLSHNPAYKMIPGNKHIICVGKVLGKVTLNVSE